MSLKDYNRKRKFADTPEPRGQRDRPRTGDLRFVVQMHSASRLHFDFRLEIGGVFKSWAVPKGPSLNPLDQRLAVFVEDHPLAYGDFEGMIPPGNYGAGTVMVWDRGTYHERGSTTRKQSEAEAKKGLTKGHITFVLRGHKLNGEFALIKLKKDASNKAWLMVKKRDEYATYKRSSSPDNTSVKTGRSLDEITAESEAKGEVWLPKRRKTAKAKVARLQTSTQGPLPRKNKPMIATAGRDEIDKSWLREPELNGLRALSEIECRRVHLYSKSGLSFAAKFPDVINDLKKQTGAMVLDGEIVGKGKKSIYYIYDILHCAGRDLRQTPLKERKKQLAATLVEGPHLKNVKSTSTGEIAKNPNSLYHAGTSKDWLRVGPAKHRSDGATREEPLLTHLDKIFWPKEHITKGDLLDYYRKMASFILPYLVDRPQSLNRHPNGITGSGFYQKDMTGHLPRWLKTERIFSESADKSINYALCQDERSLLYLANLGCIELNPWFSRIKSLDQPDFLVIDLDPDDGNSFKQVIEIAHEVHAILESVGAASACKTSGATGVHIGVPTGARYSYDEVRAFAEAVCRIVAKKYPNITSIERSPNRRRKKIYLDYMQNRRAQTLAAPFSVRPRPQAPVSMPLTWKALTPKVKPEQFTLHNAPRLVQKFDDPWRIVLGAPINLARCMRELQKKYTPGSS